MPIPFPVDSLQFPLQVLPQGFQAYFLLVLLNEAILDLDFGFVHVVVVVVVLDYFLLDFLGRLWGFQGRFQVFHLLLNNGKRRWLNINHQGLQEDWVTFLCMLRYLRQERHEVIRRQERHEVIRRVKH